MNLPVVVQDLVNAQNNFNSAHFADCFSENAIVFDEGKNYTGKKAIQKWIEKSSKEYNAVMNPISFEGDAEKGSLKAEVSGTFPGSPLVLTYNFKFEAEYIQSLDIN
ncbi:nuclear transport factor 2 family protein [Flavobacterium sp. DG2-3]|uniref:nuclear transport factor 2 family protein n=1 Tax=Flavobacterium sp. DG2-3 TaxID=3068317 RepID=UPI00273CFA28|nr:nuclear transport factor 2 family protein [Flavobacterium sp. DG2-3]MDP5199049.1 nuclear transport factor 2 family protein [Flavobacterium sp. DG2-3]